MRDESVMPAKPAPAKPAPAQAESASCPRRHPVFQQAAKQIPSPSDKTTESSTFFMEIDASNFVRDDGRIETSIRHVVAATLTAQGFDSFFDLFEIDVE